MFSEKRVPNNQFSLMNVLFILSQIVYVPMALAENTLETAVASVQSLTREFRLDGQVEAINKATVSAQTSGTIREILVDVDDYVKRGAVIMRLKDVSQQANLKKALAGEEEAISNLAKAEDEFVRIKDIYKKGVVSKAQMDDATHGLSAAKARLASARASLDEAREQLSYTRVKAPYSGIVIQRHVELGETVQPGAALMTGVSLDKLRVNVDVPQSLIANIRRYGKAFVYTDAEVDSGTGSAADSTAGLLMQQEKMLVAVEKITVFPIADLASNTFKVRLDLPEGIAGLFPGMFVKTSLVTGEKEVLVVPAKSIVHRSEVTAVYVVNDAGLINFRHVRLGSKRDAAQVILSGLVAGEKVAINPIQAGIDSIAQRRAQSAGQADE